MMARIVRISFTKKPRELIVVPAGTNKYFPLPDPGRATRSR